MQTLIMRAMDSGAGYFIGYANSMSLVTLPKGITPQAFATQMQAGNDAFLNYLRQAGGNDALVARVQSMYSASSTFEYGEFRYQVAEETATLWTDLVRLGEELLEFL